MTARSGTSVLRLYPGPTERLSLRGLYLAQGLRNEIRHDRAYCFSNFVASLDGRVSLSSSPEEKPTGVPSSLSSKGDWRLFQELVAQSDAVLVSGRYVREVVAGRAEPRGRYVARLLPGGSVRPTPQFTHEARQVRVAIPAV